MFNAGREANYGQAVFYAGYLANNCLATATGSPTGTEGSSASVHVWFCHCSAKTASCDGSGATGFGAHLPSQVVPG